MTYEFPSWQPVEPRRIVGWSNAFAVTLVGALAGTGGDVSAEQVLRHIGTGSASRALHASQAVPTNQGVAVELTSIREALRLSVAETARLFGVSRPTIYSWQNGNPINPEKAERLRAITNALAPRLRLLEAQVGRVAHRVIEGRSTLLQKLAGGASAEQAISQLSEILTREATQRKRLAKRLRGHTGSRGSAELDTLG
ncbi:MAG: hypothetical protein AB7V26_01335 [Lysobacterales bacterium]